MNQINAGITQGSPVPRILFAIYISGVFQQVEQKKKGATGLYFIDNISWIASEDNVTEITVILGECRKLAIESTKKETMQ